MNIAIDISPLESKHKNRGTGVYTKLLVEALGKYESKHSYLLIHKNEEIPANTDLIHYPYFDPFFLTLPPVRPKPTVVTVHDLIPLVFPDKFPKGIRGMIKWNMQKRSLMGANRIITDSQSSERDIHAILKFPEAKIDIIPLAPAVVFQKTIDEATIGKVREKYKLPKKFILYVGDVNWNKNISGLLEAFASFIRATGIKDVFLVLVGNAFLNSSIAEVIEINHLIDVLNIQKNVMRLGYIPDDELAGIYQGAVCLVQPSHYEGFGLPVLEAMSSGCPVVCSEISSLAEIAGPAIRINPDTIDDISSAMYEILQLSHAKRSELIQKGKIWAKTYSWQKVAKETVSVYERTTA